MGISEIINAGFNKKYTPVTGGEGVSAPKNSNGVSPKGNQTPTFGIKGKAPLTQDMFEYKGQKLTREETKRQSYNDVYRHESAHLAAAGKYAASGINIDYDGNGFAVSGHVNVKMPTLNKANPTETIEHARAVIKSAEAPASFDELSDADKSVAAQARAVLSQALSVKGQDKGQKQGSKLNFMA